jgi:hypothetical protein
VLQSVRNVFFGADDGRRLLDVPTEDLGFDEPGQPDCELVADELLGWDLEDLCDANVSRLRLGDLILWAGLLALTVDFLEGKLLGLANEAEDHEPGDEVEASVEADC